eukprot:jgi/Bigna1/66956/fgenesh1_pg.2_\
MDPPYSFGTDHQQATCMLQGEHVAIESSSKDDERPRIALKARMSPKINWEFQDATVRSEIESIGKAAHCSKRKRRLMPSDVCPKFRMAPRLRRANRDRKYFGVPLEDVHERNEKHEMTIFTRFLACKHARLEYPPTKKQIRKTIPRSIVPQLRCKRPRKIGSKRLPNGMACASCCVRKVRCCATRPCLQCVWRNELCLEKEELPEMITGKQQFYRFSEHSSVNGLGVPARFSQKRSTHSGSLRFTSHHLNIYNHESFLRP